MVQDLWDQVSDAGVGKEADGSPRFHVTIRGRTVHIHLAEGVTRRQAFRRFSEAMSTAYAQMGKDDRILVDHILDDLFDRFGKGGESGNQVLEWSSEAGTKASMDWTDRLVRRDLRHRGVPERIPRERLEAILDELYVVDPILKS